LPQRAVIGRAVDQGVSQLGLLDVVGEPVVVAVEVEGGRGSRADLGWGRVMGLSCGWEAVVMGQYLFNLSKKGAAKGQTLREQASQLLALKMWGVGAKTPNRNSFTPGDRVLIYVGAPEFEFIGHAELASATRQWTPEEAGRYAGSFDGGVLFSQTQIWEHPVPMKTVLPELDLKETNPRAIAAGRCRWL